MEQFPIRKPTWMNQNDWREFLQTNKPYACRECGSMEDLTVDHIVPRHEGGSDDLSNLQILCGHCNSSKGIRPSLFWQQNFYFDNKPNLEAMRVAQREQGYEVVLRHADWFNRPLSQINRVLYTLGWIVGSGKTMAIPTLGWALNHVMLRDRGRGWPRINRILVLCKEQAIRDQIADDLTRDVTKFGLLGSGPSVGIVTDGQTFDHDAVLDRCDIWVSCIHQIWERGNGMPRTDVERVLAQFPLIVIDEPHYAMEQVLKIVERAYKSLVFGNTGSPLDAQGDVLTKFVLFSIFDYVDAQQYDNSVKYLTADSGDWRTFVDEIGIDEADVIRPGAEEVKIKDTKEEKDYSINLPPSLSVAQRVVQYVNDCDGILPLGASAAPHRPEACDAILSYPIHAIVVADSITLGEQLTKQMNEMFERDRRRYPESLGYRTEMVHAGSAFQGDGNKRAKKLTPDHAWMRAKHQNGKIDSQCARFLTVVGMGREGVNNPLCGVIGVACKVNSVVEHVQRSIGRQLRSWHIAKNERLLVPPDRLDTVRIITHKAFENGEAIKQAIDFTQDMHGWLEPMMTMEELVDGTYVVRAATELSSRDMLTIRERWGIVGGLGGARVRGVEPDLTDMIDKWGGESVEKRRKVKAWIDFVINDPSGAYTQLIPESTPRARTVVRREYPKTDPTEEELLQHLRIHEPELVEEYLANMALHERWARKMYYKHAKQFYLSDFKADAGFNIDTIRMGLARKVREEMGSYLVGDKKAITAALHTLVAVAVRQVLGIPEGEPASIGGRYDAPPFHTILTRPDVQREMIDYVRDGLMRKGYLPAMSAMFPFSEEIYATQTHTI